MKTLKRIFASTILILAMGLPLYAGDVNMPANSGPTPPAPAPATCNSCEPETQSLETSEFAVDLLLALLSFF